MGSFAQSRLAYLAKAREAEYRAAHSVDPVIKEVWRTMADGYMDLAKECEELTKDREGFRGSSLVEETPAEPAQGQRFFSNG
jgi:hypothetical protein